MKFLSFLAVTLTVTTVFFLLSANPAKALINCTLSPAAGHTYTFSTDKSLYQSDLGPGDWFDISFTTANSGSVLDNIYRSTGYEIAICNENVNGAFYCGGNDYVYFHVSDGEMARSGNRFTARLSADQFQEGDYRAVLRGIRVNQTEAENICANVSGAFIVDNISNSNVPADCSSLSFTPNPIRLTDTSITISYNTSGIHDSGEYKIWYNENNEDSAISNGFRANSGIFTVTFPVIDPANGGNILLRTSDTDPGSSAVFHDACSINLSYDPNTGTTTGATPTNGTSEFILCNQIPDETLKNTCETCENPDGEGNRGIWTAVGCIRTEPETIVRQVLTIALSIAGGIALLMILAAGFLFSTSQGDPKRVGEARELMSSAVIGLMFILFSVTMLQFIGVSILKIPGFGG